MEQYHLDYECDGNKYTALVAHPKTLQKLPCVIVVHAWAGRDDFANNKALALAELGFVGVAIDLYGAGVVGASVEENQRLMQPLLDDRFLIIERIKAALQAIKGLEVVDAERVAAIGFCFGGLCVLDMARCTDELQAVVSFHGNLANNQLGDKVQGTKILVLHGNDDPSVPHDMLVQFMQEMSERQADWQVHVFSDTKHAFMREGDDNPALGNQYNPLSAKRAWELMQSFLQQSL